MELRMKPSEVLERAREAALRIKAIDAEIKELHDRIGVQGHSYGFHGKNDIRDPMRKVDEMIDGTVDLETEREECEIDIIAAWRVIDGLSAMDSETREKYTTDHEYVLTEYYIYAKSDHELAEGTGYPESVCMRAVREAVRMCDEIGLAGLNAARLRGKYAY